QIGFDLRRPTLAAKKQQHGVSLCYLCYRRHYMCRHRCRICHCESSPDRRLSMVVWLLEFLRSTKDNHVSAGCTRLDVPRMGAIPHSIPTSAWRKLATRHVPMREAEISAACVGNWMQKSKTQLKRY